MILAFMALIMTKRLTPMVALIVVPTIFGLFAGAGLGIGDMVLEAIGSLAPTAALLMFAIMYFGIMIDVGLFDPLIRFIVRALGDDPAKVVLGTALLAGAVSLDGDGSTTFIVTTAAMLPIYLRLGMNPVVLTCVAGLANGTLNIVPWGGPTVRAAAALQVSPSDIFVPMLPSLAVGLAVTLVFAWFLGLGERRRLGTLALAEPMLERELVGADRGTSSRASGLAALTGGIRTVARERFSFLRGPQSLRGAQIAVAARVQADDADTAMADTMLDPERETLRPKLIWVNLVLTLAVMTLLVADILPLPYVFMVGSAVALLINFPTMKDQASEIVKHAPSIVGVVSMVLAAGVLIGVLNGTGMVDAMAKWVVAVIPPAMGPFLAVITGVLSIPMTFFMSNDAFYYGILPVLSESAANYGISPVEMARASITGQPVHLQSPLVPAILLLVSLAAVNLGDHHRKVLWRAVIVSLVMLAVGVLVGSVPFG
ncbi:CitMHS family transporter [Rathayibacter iranicus]|uniref:Citrate:proton symporter n=2 Tax=Rathayibacter iranicus TaxID=59737 RepID=A0AAD1AFT1_9MICO|nr:CitMHS family transporter [Rathayibacter iranicus]AZZ57423.1 citrate:proton symporter [Rathayibacter iranicus]MWV30152.1 citrate:proton symporter [Rathayibacter iranicus NCPPB 2253 = VKM Ac-1602]PPI46303.1 citrate:proton symporter [Rathayibacter iranicus]PPI59751.1 citrate:proton symporter [Rathayibacter iranicus]PPI71155.1 citrate:proton symporter [Rathayibacter iranicus]